jgi:putative redox protein
MADPRVTTHQPSTGFSTMLTARQHTLIADEPLENGGSDAGPQPFELLLASLGACTSITLRMYARRKDWPAGDIDVDLTLGNGPDGRKRIERIIAIGGDLTPEQRARLLEIANACPVHKTLTAGVTVESRIRD